MAEEDDTEDQLPEDEGAEIPASRADYNRYLDSLPTISRAD